MLDYLKLICAAAGTGGTQIRYAVKVDGGGANRYTSGSGLATAPVTGLNTNIDSGTVSNAQFYAGAIVAAAANAARLIAHGMFRSVIPVVADQYLLNFGGIDPAIGGLIPTGAAVTIQSFPAPPVVVGPGEWCAIHLWLPSQSVASSFEFELGYWER